MMPIPPRKSVAFSSPRRPLRKKGMGRYEDDAGGDAGGQTPVLGSDPLHYLLTFFDKKKRL